MMVRAGAIHGLGSLVGITDNYDIIIVKQEAVRPRTTVIRVKYKETD